MMYGIGNVIPSVILLRDFSTSMTARWIPMTRVTLQVGQIKDPKVGRLSWILWVGPKWEAEEIRPQKRRRQCDPRGSLEGCGHQPRNADSPQKLGEPPPKKKTQTQNNEGILPSDD